MHWVDMLQLVLSTRLTVFRNRTENSDSQCDPCKAELRLLYLSCSCCCTPSFNLLSPDSPVCSKPVTEVSFSKTSVWPKTLLRRTLNGLLYGVVTSSSPPNVKLCLLTLPFKSSFGWLGALLCTGMCADDLVGACFRIPVVCFPLSLTCSNER